MTRAALLLVLLALIAPRGAEAFAQTSVDRRIPARPDAPVRIHNLVGSIRITGWARDTIAVTGSVATGGGRFYMGGGEAGAKLGVELPTGAAEKPGSHLEVRVPAGSRVWVKSASATIEVVGVTGGLDLSSVSGDITVRGPTREVRAESLDGDIRIGGPMVWARAKTAGGSVHLEGVVEDLGLSSVSGRLEVTGGPFDRGRFETVTGDIRYSAAPGRGSLDLESHSGTIELRLPAGSPAELSVTSFSGTIENGLSPARPLAAGEGGRELVFATGIGGADISIRSFKGAVLLRRQ